MSILALVVAVASGRLMRIAALVEPSCAVGVPVVVVNGSFESPGITGLDAPASRFDPQPTSPTGTVNVIDRATAAAGGRAVDGDVYIFSLQDDVQQAISMAGRSGTTLRVDFVRQAAFPATPSIDGASLPVTNESVNRYRATYTVPATAPVSVVPGFGGQIGNELDAVTVTVVMCGVVPTATAAAPTAPITTSTATVVPTATATATVRLTAGPAGRPPGP